MYFDLDFLIPRDCAFLYFSHFFYLFLLLFQSFYFILLASSVDLLESPRVDL